MNPNDVFQLIRIDYDSYEDLPIRETIVATFAGDIAGTTAYGKLCEWMIKQEPTKLYWGMDNEAYPRFKARKLNLTS